MVAVITYHLDIQKRATFEYDEVNQAIFSWATPHTDRKAHFPILTVLWFFEVLCVTVHHTEFLPIELKLGQLSILHSCTHPDLLQVHDFWKQISHTLSIASFAAFLICNTKFARL